MRVPKFRRRAYFRVLTLLSLPGLGFRSDEPSFDPLYAKSRTRANGFSPHYFPARLTALRKKSLLE
jgi:hypothetical protein